jgi:hypothetical protein
LVVGGLVLLLRLMIFDILVGNVLWYRIPVASRFIEDHNETLWYTIPGGILFLRRRLRASST